MGVSTVLLIVALGALPGAILAFAWVLKLSETGLRHSVEQATREHDIDLARSYVVGDMAKDIEMGQRAGTRTVLVLTGYGEQDRDKVEPDFTTHDLAEAVAWIERDMKGTA